MSRLDGKVALITGGGSGIGRETSLLFAAEGALIAAVDVNQAATEETVELVAQTGGKALAIVADVADVSSVADMVAQTESAFGRLDVLFNNAGIMHSADDDAVNTDEAVWDLTMDINAKGVFLGCKFGIPAIQRAGGGSIINTASFVAVLGAATPQVAYTASKGAVLAMTRELAVVHARENIRVNALCPGPTVSNMSMSVMHARAERDNITVEEMVRRRAAMLPTGRWNQPQDVAALATFLASPDADNITGQAWNIDGGLIMVA
jgi:NAD(P)-dependent dehydrogenase (short-subunit alcohol dehydrogenase family)